MKNTGTIYLSTERKPTVRTDFAELLPPLTDEQLLLLEEDIQSNGCYSPIIVNENLVVVDGHNRMSICEKHDLPYQLVVFSFEDDLEAKQWALDTQKSRRNLSINELCKIAMKLRPDVEARAEQRKANNGGDKKSDAAKSEMATLPSPISNEKDSVRHELAATVGIGERTMGKAMKIEDEAPDTVKEAVDSGDLTINQGYNITREVSELPEDEQEQAAMEAVMRELNKKNEKRMKQINLEAKTAKQFCAAFEHGVQIEPTVENIRIWIENAGVKHEHIDGMIDDARQIADAFTTIADVLENTIKPTDWRAQIGKAAEKSDTEPGEADNFSDT